MDSPVNVSEDQKKWQAEEDARTLVKAEEIKADKARVKAALAILKEQSKNTKKVIGEQP